MTKINPKIRFQNSYFQKRLQEARGYKRAKRILPQTQLGVLLAKVGLGSWTARLFTLLILLLLIYAVYIPNIFFIKNIQISGIEASGQAAVATSVQSFLNHRLPWPQKNLFLLSRPGLNDFLIRNNQQILKVDKISKKIPNTLIINIIPRTGAFVIQTLKGNYTISNDGLVSQKLFTDHSTTSSPLNVVKIIKDVGISPGQKAFDQGRVNFLNGLFKQLPDIVKAPIQSLELTDLDLPDLTVNVQSGLNLFFDLNQDLLTILNQLKELLARQSSAQQKNLYYIDMRFKNKSYLCYKGTACVNDINLSKPAATTTSVSGKTIKTNDKK